VLNNIGTVLMSVKAYPKAIIYFDSALKINERFNFRGGILQTCNNLGSSFYQLDSFDISKKYLVKALDVARANDEKQDMAATYLTLGKMLIKAKKYHLARKYLDSSLSICKLFDLKYGLMVNNFTRGRYFEQLNQYDSAIFYFKCNMEQIDKLDMAVERSAIYENLYNIYKKSGAIDSALRYHELFTIAMDSINQKKVQQQIAELEIKYQNEKNLNEIQKLNESMYYLQSRTRLYIIGFLLIVSTLLFYILIRRHKSKTIALKNKLFEKEQENLRIELEVRERKLTLNAMHMIRVNEVSYFVSSKLKSLLPQVNLENNHMLIELINELDSAARENIWEEFETRFRNVHQDFNNNLIHLYPELTPTEVKICSFIRLNLTNKDIAVITKRSLRTIENTRNHIRKKMNLDKDANLTRLLLSI
ncbi:MAG: tetratricopeptide repeat protein, partial [Bacteroidales bacterium]|nr:tetratricopeptide repeat protein [Bacteroidales bacterium]